MESKVESANVNTEEANEASNNEPKKEAEKDQRYKAELTRAIRENHGYDIADARWCPFEGGNAYFATIGSNQLNVYDCEVRGNFISTLMNYRNWHLQTMRTKNIVWKENLEKNHPLQLEKKRFNALCWMRRYRDYWICLADNEQQIHVMSMTFSRCIKLIKVGTTIIDLIAHPMFPNVLVTIDMDKQCHFRNTTDDSIIYTLEDKICQIAFSPSGNKFVVALVNGSIREYTQKVEMGAGDNDDDTKTMDTDDDTDMGADSSNESDNTRNRNRNMPHTVVKVSTNKKGKRLIVDRVQDIKMEKSGNDICQLLYKEENELILSNALGELRHINLGNNGDLVHKWRIDGMLMEGSICKFALNKSRDCLVYGNMASEVLIYDLKAKKVFRKINGGRNRNKQTFSFSNFCANHEQSVLMVQGSVIMKFDPLCLVEGYFPSTADFATQKKCGVKLFREVKDVTYNE